MRRPTWLTVARKAFAHLAKNPSSQARESEAATQNLESSARFLAAEAGTAGTYGNDTKNDSGESVMRGSNESAMLFLEPETNQPAAELAKVISGVFPYQHLVAMYNANEIIGRPEILADQFQPASMDLRLGQIAYRVPASFLPGPDSTVMDKVKTMDPHEIDLSEGALLERGHVYVVQLEESVRIPNNVTGTANPKSSTGRLDVLTRLITNKSAAFDHIEAGYAGPLFVEIAPQTFGVIVRRGSRLNQVRFYRGTPAAPTGDILHRYEQGHLVYASGTRKKVTKDLLVPVTIDLQGSGPGGAIGYRARKSAGIIDVDRVRSYDPHDFWEPIRRHRGTLVLELDEFYILATREEVGVPPDLAAEMVPYHSRSGEYRVHYAGFFDPGFGYQNGARGSKAVLEVRSHEVPFMLEHGQTVGWLKYERMTQTPSRVYGSGLKSHYQNQGLALAKQFRGFND